jgi:dihydropteroate synthase
VVGANQALHQKRNHLVTKPSNPDHLSIPRRQTQLTRPVFADDQRLGGKARCWWRPVALAPMASGYDHLIPLSNTGLGFGAVDILERHGDDFTITRMAPDHVMRSAREAGAEAVHLAEQQWHHLTSPRPDFSDLSMDQHRIMGIINTTPDSFSDGGDHFDANTAIACGMAMADAGADILDIGGESTRPGAEQVSYAEETARILPVISHLSDAGHIVSADTRHTQVMAKALDAGARIINDVAGLRDEGSEALVAHRSCPVVIMHMQGQPGTMQKSPSYDFVAADVYDWLEQRIAAATAANVPRSQIAVDIGFGFGKTPQHNMTLMAWLSLFHGLGVPLLLGVSRKSTISHFSKAEKAKDRMPGSLALATLGYSQGVQMFRVHDVAETAQALALAAAMRLADQH